MPPSSVGQRPDFCRILLLGDNGSGKTSLITRFVFNVFSASSISNEAPTAPNRHRTQRMVSSYPCIIELVEAEPLPGASKNGDVHADIVKEIANADAVVLVYSICGLRWHPLHREIGSERDAWRTVPLEGVRRFGNLVKGHVLSEEEGQGSREEEAVMLVLGCQRDREDLRIVKEDDGRALAGELGCGFAEVEVESGCEGINVVIDRLVMQVREQRKWRAGGSCKGERLSTEKDATDATATRFWERMLRR
ncbi:hypothetical protein ONS95_008134 [Cadophora gregata]|uniref:uncharacterized protein n=1 Tax=Cadophora gregata TaxID=51156 RepID=UPI0026DB8D65|nr:uncharacterized protein ONS95_008134 [Cadophora gregata]KAK0119287.1 hypothetical protein ONS96_012345 [Cadophora gregata f. sp. sojae]KAK0126541.1 hypothetical protein ONS95_008134 [Cadophora gregata]